MDLSADAYFSSLDIGTPHALPAATPRPRNSANAAAAAAIVAESPEFRPATQPRSQLAPACVAGYVSQRPLLTASQVPLVLQHPATQLPGDAGDTRQLSKDIAKLSALVHLVHHSIEQHKTTTRSESGALTRALAELKQDQDELRTRIDAQKCTFREQLDLFSATAKMAEDFAAIGERVAETVLARADVPRLVQLTSAAHDSVAAVAARVAAAEATATAGAETLAAATAALRQRTEAQLQSVLEAQARGSEQQERLAQSLDALRASAGHADMANASHLMLLRELVQSFNSNTRGLRRAAYNAEKMAADGPAELRRTGPPVQAKDDARSGRRKRKAAAAADEADIFI